MTRRSDAGRTDGGEPETPSTGGDFWDVICGYDYLARIALAVEVFLLVLQLLALPGIPRGSAAWVVTWLNFVVLGVLILLMAGTLWRCRRREPKDRF